MAKIIYKNRSHGGYKYTSCPICNNTVEVDRPVQLEMPYCGDCGMIVLDCSQKFCCWCGAAFEKNHKKTNS